MLKLVSKSAEDTTLIAQFKKGNEQAFRMLVNNHKEKVRNLIYFTMGNKNHVDDLAQDVFIKVYNNLDKFRQDARFTTWLYRITVNQCRDELRKQKIRTVLTLTDDAKSISGEHYASKNVQELVQEGISRLPEKLRLPLVLKELQGHSYEEIAEITNTEMGTVKSRLFRAKQALREILAPIQKELIS